MKSAYDLLMTAPDTQVTRLKMVFKDIAADRCGYAAFTLRNAAKEESGEWAKDAYELANYLSEIAA